MGKDDINSGNNAFEYKNATMLTLMPPNRLPRMPHSALLMNIQEGMEYIQRFFNSNIPLMQAFIIMGTYISCDNPEIKLRVSGEYLGYAKADEKSRVYISQRYGGHYYVKFKHRNAPEPYDIRELNRYLKECKQCNQYAKSYPDTMKFT